MNKIFVLTGEPSGDKLASNVIKSLNEKKKDIEYLGVCGNNLKSLGIKSIYDQKDITYMAFTDVIFNFLKIKNWKFEHSSFPKNTVLPQKIHWHWHHFRQKSIDPWTGWRLNSYRWHHRSGKP